MIRLIAVLIAVFAVLAGVQPNPAQAQSAEYFAQLQRDKIKCDKAGKEWDGRRCQPKGFFKPKLRCKEGFKPVNGQCKKIHKPWSKPYCAVWKSACRAGNNSACGNYEAKCQVN